MSNLVFPGVGSPYRGFVGEIRGWFRRIATYAEKSPQSKAVINTQLAILAANLGFQTALPNTQAVVTNGQKIAGVTGTGTFANIAVNPTTKAVTVTLTAS